MRNSVDQLMELSKLVEPMAEDRKERPSLIAEERPLSGSREKYVIVPEKKSARVTEGKPARASESWGTNWASIKRPEPKYIQTGTSL